MLTYNDTIKKSLSKVLKNKNVIVNAILVFLPVFIGIIVNAIILSDFNQELTLLLEEYSLMVFDSMTSEDVIITRLVDGILMTISKNGNSITASIIIYISTYLFSSLLECIIYYAVYCTVEKKEFSRKESFKVFVKMLPLFLYKTLIIFLWSLLFIIPGIYKSIEYALCYSIKIENPHYTSKECLIKSSLLMLGRKERLFLQLLYSVLFVIIINFVVSTVFSILSILPFISLVANDLVNATTTAITLIINFSIIAIFYNEIKFDEKVIEENPELKERGVTVIIRPDPDRKVRYFYTSSNPYNPPNYNNNNYNPYQNVNFKRQDIYNQNNVKEENPFDKAEREVKEEEDNK